MKRLSMSFVVVLSVLLSINSHSAGCTEDEISAFKTQIKAYFTSHQQTEPEIEHINFNCFVEPISEDDKREPWKDNVAIVFKTTIKDLPFYDKKAKCYYWQHAEQGHMKCEALKKKAEHS